MVTDFAVKELPQKRTGGFLSWVGRTKIFQILLIGGIIYFVFVVAVSAIEFEFHLNGRYPVLGHKGVPVTGFVDILYFNLITTLTIGYGDLRPASYGRALSVIEAFCGVGLFTVLVAVITVKALLPPRNTVVFSKYAYYCTEPERFLIVFVNTTRENIGNVGISSYFKLGGDWDVKPPITSPFITRSVQTFYVDRVCRQKLSSQLREGDCLRVGIAGGLGFSNFSTSIQYSTDSILVIPNRDRQVDFFEPRWAPNFRCPEFQQMFHYRPEQALTLRAFAEEARRSGSS